MECIRKLQGRDPVIRVILDQLDTGLKPSHLKLPVCPEKIKRWLQIWTQLYIQDGILLRRIATVGPHPFREVLVVPDAMKSHFMQQCHDSPSAGYQGFQKTLDRLKEKTYWIGMAADVCAYCESCDRCHRVKDPPPTRIPLITTPIGRPWEMIAVDVLKLPISANGNKYLLVIQDYFTKWLEAIPLKDQTADTIVKALTKVFSVFGFPKFLHSDQGV